MLQATRDFDRYRATHQLLLHEYFVHEIDMDESGIERTLRPGFHNHTKRSRKLFVPGLRPPPAYPKLSVLTKTQHHQLLKVLCAKRPHILKKHCFNKPTDYDYYTFETLKAIYEDEQKEFIEWAKTLWISEHYIRTLSPKLSIELIYKMESINRASRVFGFPTRFDIAAQISLQCTTPHQYNIDLIQILQGVNTTDLPSVELPQPIQKKMSVIKACSYPEPCHKHLYKFILPNEYSITKLSITELHRELALYAVENGSRFISSENALRCLVELNRYWTIPITVCQEFTLDGKSCNVVVLDSEFFTHREPAMTRTYKAMKHMLENKLIPAAGVEHMIARRKENQIEQESKIQNSSTYLALAIDKLHISSDQPQFGLASGNINTKTDNDKIEVYDYCKCTNSRYGLPPMRSFKKWRIRNENASKYLDVIVHCAHKAKYKSKEVVLEPIPEYQLEMGGSEQPPDRIRALVLALMFRENSILINVRLDGFNGEIVTIDTVSADEFTDAHSEKRHQVLNIMYTTLRELQCLQPGHYLLQHAPGHGANAFLHVARPNGDSFKLEFNHLKLTETDEAEIAKQPPTLAPVLMPYHKFRKILPCAFTPCEEQKPPAKPNPPPKTNKYQKKTARKTKSKK